MNTEDSEFERIEREQKMRAVPDAIHHADTSETMEYTQGWNDCRQAMLAEQPEHHDPIGDAQDKLIAEKAAQAQRKPLTDEEVWAAIRPLTKSDEVCAALVRISISEYRAIETAHGIKENT